MGRPTTHYLSTLPSHHSASHSSTSTSRRSRSSSPRPTRIPPSSSSPSPRKPRPSFLPINNLNLPSPSATPRGWVDEWFLTKEEWNAHPLNKERSPVPRPRRRRHRRRELSSSDEDEDQEDARLHPHDGEEESSPRATRRRRGPLFGNFESLLMEDEAEGRVGAREQEGGQEHGNDLERLHGIASARDSASQRDPYLRLLGVTENEEEEDVQSPSPPPTHTHAEPQAQAQPTSPSALSPSPLTMATSSSSNWTPAAEL